MVLAHKTRGVARTAQVTRRAVAAGAVDVVDRTSAQPHVAVVGAGLVGLTSAHALLRRGFRVTVIDRQRDVASECSFGNAALLMSSYSRPKTASIFQLIKWACTRSEPVHVSWRALLDPKMVSFGLRFFIGGPQTQARIKSTTAITDSLAQASGRILDCLRAERGFRTASTDKGLLMYFTDKAKLDAMVKENVEALPVDRREACMKVISPEEVVALEPILAKRQCEIVGGVYWPLDRTICPLSFSRELAASLGNSGVTFRLGEDVKGAFSSAAGGGASSARRQGLVLASGEVVEADAVVVAAGVGSGLLLQRLSAAGGGGLSPVTLYGMRGHSVTLDVTGMCGNSEGLASDAHVLNRSLCDGDAMTFYSPLPPDESRPGRRLLRMAAFGDFDGWGYGPAAVRPWRLEQLMSAAKGTFGPAIASISAQSKSPGGLGASPGAGSALEPSELCPESDTATRWCGLRPMSPDGLPLVGQLQGTGATKPGVLPLFVNAGHGALGWTLSPACGELLATSVAQALLSESGSAPDDIETELRPVLPLLPHLDPNRFRWSRILREGAMALRGGA